MFFYKNNTVSRILVLTTFDAWEISFSSYSGNCFKVKWLHNGFLRDIWRHYDLLKAADINSKKHLLENIPHLKELSKGTRVFSNDGREDLFNALSNIIVIIILDTHVIKSQLGGNGNGIVISFSNIENCSTNNGLSTSIKISGVD